VETLLMIQQKDMSTRKQVETCFDLYHGKIEIQGQAEKLMKGMGPYATIWASEQTKSGPRRVVQEQLHQQIGKVVVASDNITDRLIKLTYASKTDILKGKTLIALAKDVMKEVRKMSSLLCAAIDARVLCLAENGEYNFPSGKSEDDFDHFMLKRMNNWDKHYGASGGKTNGDENDNDDNDADLEMVTHDSNVDSNTNNEDDDSDESMVPNDIFASDDNEILHNTSSIRDDVEDSDEEPDDLFLPKGWVVFKTRGLAPIKDRLDFFARNVTDGCQRNIKHGRKNFRLDEAAKKNSCRDFEFDNSRGLGATNRKSAVRAAQRDAQRRINTTNPR
jgi:hypothetical protein